MLEKDSFKSKNKERDKQSKKNRWIENVIPTEMEIHLILRSFRFSIYRQLKTCLQWELGLKTP